MAAQKDLSQTELVLLWVKQDSIHFFGKRTACGDMDGPYYFSSECAPACPDNFPLKRCKSDDLLF